MSTEEQAEYDALYSQAFNGEKPIESPEEEVEEEEILEQPEEAEEEEAEETLDGEEETEPTDEAEEDSKDEPYLTVTRHGQTIPMTKEEAEKFASFGFDYTSKTQDLAKDRQLVELANDNGVTAEELKTLIDMKQGNKEAFGHISKQAGIDPYDIDTDSNYIPKVDKKNYALEDAINTVQSDKEYAQTVDSWLEMLPRSAKQMISDDPKILLDIHTEARNGIAQKVMPTVIKEMLTSPMSDFKQSYLRARQSVVSQPETKREEVSREVKKKATTAKKKASKHTKEKQDVWNDDELYAKMQKLARS